MAAIAGEEEISTEWYDSNHYSQCAHLCSIMHAQVFSASRNGSESLYTDMPVPALELLYSRCQHRSANLSLQGCFQTSEHLYKGKQDGSVAGLYLISLIFHLYNPLYK